MKKQFLFVICIMIFIAGILTGCSSGSVSIYIVSMPNKLGYEIGEKLDLSGLKVETLNTDGTTTTVRWNDKDINFEGTEQAGEKKVEIKNNNHTTQLSVYVANVVVSEGDNVKQKIEQAEDGDVVLIKNGDYNNEEFDEIIINKKLVIVGENSSKVIFGGKFFIGASNSAGGYVANPNLEDVRIYNINFKRENKLQNNVVVEKEQTGAINGFSTKNLLVSGCSFNGHSYGIIMNSANGLTIKNNKFYDQFVSGIKVNENAENIAILKNVFARIGSNVLIEQNGKQGYISCIDLSFSQKGNAGVIISNNTFNRTAEKRGKWIYFGENSKQLENSKDLTKLSFVNNSAIVILSSIAEENLQVGGVILSANNYGTTMQNIMTKKGEGSQINQTGIILNENF